MAKEKNIFSIRNSLIIAGAFIATGLLLLGADSFNTWRGERVTAQSTGLVLASNSENNNTVSLISGTPVNIVIPSVNIDLKVTPGYYNPKNQSWTLSLNDAQWGTMTAQANNRGGATFIYGHYRKGVFLYLPKIQPGAIAKVTTDNGHLFTYVFRGSRTTTPEDTSLFNYRGRPVLVLQTCTGVWYQNRQLFSFDLAEVR